MCFLRKWSQKLRLSAIKKPLHLCEPGSLFGLEQKSSRGLMKTVHESVCMCYAGKCQNQDVLYKWIIKDASPSTVYFNNMTRSKLSHTILLPSSHFAAGCTATSLKYGVFCWWWWWFFFLLSLDFFKAKLADIDCKVCRLQSKAQSTA